MSNEWGRFDRAQNGDSAAWEELLECHQSRLAALGLLITGSAAAADDIVQETFLRAFQSRIRHRRGTVHGYLTTIAYRLALKEKKREQRNVRMESANARAKAENPLDEILASERDRSIAEAIQTLEEDHRDAMVLRFYGDHDYKDIARLLDIPHGTAKSRVFYAVRKCREILKEKGIIE